MAALLPSKTQAFAAIDGLKLPMKHAIDKPSLPVIAVLPQDDSYRLCKKDEMGETLQVFYSKLKLDTHLAIAVRV